MRIYSMTATFGKLSHETLTLEPGLNIIEAPNEWGKSTWCAFLTAMLYGLDTRAKSTKTSLADKERFAPWSGEPMSGRMDVCWNGRDITIERKTRGRVPLGVFRAYETASGLPVTELTAANCGQVLLGVERSVFLRAGFIRLNDLPLTNDENLRRRLNALVTTGDESGAGQRLAEELKALKNRCRYHRSGLLPQLEAQRGEAEGTYREIETLEEQTEKLRQRLKETEERIADLENHKNHLAYGAAQADAARVMEARQLRNEMAQELAEWKKICDFLPEQEQVRWMLGKIDGLQQEVQALEMEARMVHLEAPEVEKPAFAGDCSPEALLRKVSEDEKRFSLLRKRNRLLPALGLLGLIGGGVLAYWYRIPGAMVLLLGAVLLLGGWLVNRKRAGQAGEMIDFYGSDDPQSWLLQAQRYETACRKAAKTAEKQLLLRTDIQNRGRELDDKIQRITQGKGLYRCREEWQEIRNRWDAMADAYREFRRVESHLQTLEAMAKTARKPERPDALSDSPEETEKLLSEAHREKNTLQSRLSQFFGRMEALGDKKQLEQKLRKLDRRIRELEETYAALTIAQETLEKAIRQLQNRFAPRINREAKERMAVLTEGRYDRLQLAQDLSLLAGAEQEDTLREVLWRSDGTVDQLYLALRLAVAAELAADAPLVLDDALVRFDDTRLKAALNLLQKEAQGKQVLLFTCQSREKNLMNPGR